MVLFIGYHATSRKHRPSIKVHGLSAHKPAPFQPHGVYVFNDYMSNPALQHTWWTHNRPQDLWRVAYCGPMRPDPFVENGIVIPTDVTSVTLVTGNDLA